MEDKKTIVQKIIDEKYLKAVYQPIVSLKDGSIHAYEALSRIIMDEANINIAEMFELAEEYGLLWELEKQCRTNALKGARNKPKKVKLFINIDGNVLRDEAFQEGFTKEKLEKYSIDIGEVVLEITERSDFDDRTLLERIMTHYRMQGYMLALDDLGSGYSGLNRLQIIKPGYVKIDYELVHEIHKDKSKKSLVRMLARYCDDMEYKLIAEGIETEEELKCLINIGVEYGQGFFLQKPDVDFKKLDKNIEKKIKNFQKKNNENRHKIGKIGRMGTVLYPSCSVSHAQNMFNNNEHLMFIAIVDRECKFCGLIERDKVLNYSGIDSDSVEAIMNIDIIQIDADKSIKNAIGKLMIREENSFNYPFVLLKKHRYFGIATIRDLIIAVGKELL